MSTEEISMSAIMTAVAGLVGGIATAVIARTVLTIPTVVCVVGVLVVLALAIAYAAGVRAGGGVNGR